MDPFVRQLASLSRQHVTRSKWVFVPSNPLGRTVEKRIARKHSDCRPKATVRREQATDAS
jgi:hypothetical protein